MMPYLDSAGGNARSPGKTILLHGNHLCIKEADS